jgi:hypothetical protein
MMQGQRLWRYVAAYGWTSPALALMKWNRLSEATRLPLTVDASFSRCMDVPSPRRMPRSESMMPRCLGCHDTSDHRTGAQGGATPGSLDIASPLWSPTEASMCCGLSRGGVKRVIRIMRPTLVLVTPTGGARSPSMAGWRINRGLQSFQVGNEVHHFLYRREIIIGRHF